MLAVCMPASINQIRRQHLRSAQLLLSIGKSSLTTASNLQKISMEIASSRNLPSRRSSQHMSQQSLLVHTSQFMTNTRARRQFLLESMLVNLSSNMSMLKISLKSPSKVLPTSRRPLVLPIHLESTTRLRSLNTTGAQWRTSAA